MRYSKTLIKQQILKQQTLNIILKTISGKFAGNHLKQLSLRLILFRYLYFRFYEDEKVNFSPTKQYTLNLLKIEETYKDFSQFEKMDVVPIQDIINWYNRKKLL